MGDRTAIFVITGVMASGKSTVAELLAKSFPKGVHVRGDVFRKMVVSGRREMSPGAPAEAVEQLRLRHRLTADTASAYFEAGFTVVVQDVILAEHLPELLANLRGEPIFPVALRPRTEIVAERERTRPKSGYSEGWLVRELDESLANTPGIQFWIDSSEQTPEETAREILAKTLGT